MTYLWFNFKKKKKHKLLIGLQYWQLIIKSKMLGCLYFPVNLEQFVFSAFKLGFQEKMCTFLQSLRSSENLLLFKFIYTFVCFGPANTNSKSISQPWYKWYFSSVCALGVTFFFFFANYKVYQVPIITMYKSFLENIHKEQYILVETLLSPWSQVSFLHNHSLGVIERGP